MTLTPFTQAHADEIAEDFEDLIDTSFKWIDGIRYSIENVMVCPFDPAEQTTFATTYHTTRDKEASLNTFKGSGFDVMIFAYKGRKEEEFIALNVRTYTEQLGIRYNFEMDAH